MIDKNGAYLPLTQSQYLLWTGQKLNPDTPLYNVPYSFEITGMLNEATFGLAFQELINRVDVLRTIFMETPDGPQQQFLPEVHHKIKVLNFEGETSKTEAEKWMQAQSQKLFDLSKPVFDSALLKFGNEKYFWFLNIHHLITDATSSTVLFNLMSEIYTKVKEDAIYEIPKIPKYENYISYEGEQSIKNVATKDYWKNKVSDFLEIPKLYGSKKNSVSSGSARISTTLSKDQTQKLKALAAQPEMRSWTSDLSIFNIVSAVLFIYLYRVSGQKKLAIGAPVHNRTSQDFKNTVGLFIEILPLTLELSENDSFHSIIQKVRLESNEFLRYAETGVSSAEVSRSFNTIFNYIHTNFSDFAGLPVNTNWIHPDHCDPSHHLRCHLYDMDDSGEMELVFDLNTDVFREHTIENLPNHFLGLLETALENTDTPIGKPKLVSNSELDTSKFQGPSVAISELSVVDLFEKRALTNPNSVVLEQGNRTMTYTEVNQKANQLAHYLSDVGISEGKRVVLHFFRSTEYIVSLLAVMKTGATFIPIASEQPKSRIKYIIENSDCSLVLTQENLKENIDPSVPIFDFTEDSAKIATRPNHDLEIQNSTKSIAYILYTSGSTGNPKGVLVPNGALANYLSWAGKYYEVATSTIFPFFTSIGFDLTITSTFLPLLNGGKLIIYKEAGLGPDISLFQVLGANMVTAIKLTPSHLQFLKGRDMSNSQIKTMIVGGEDFKTELAKSVKNALGEDLKIYNEYGPTEATVGCIVSEFSAQKHTSASVSIGNPIQNVQAYILDSHMNQVPQGVIGELYIGGSGLADGYLNLPELTSEKFIDNPFEANTKMYHTGDLARLNHDGEMEYLGRVDEQIKLRGFRIELSDIESNLSTHEQVDNCAVVLLENEKTSSEEEITNCAECGLPSNYPSSDFDDKGVCHVCNAFKGYKDKAQRYFKTEDELQTLLTSERGKSPNYDCLSLLSGGKDSTYILAQLINMGLKVLAFTLDNGYISEQAKGNIDRIVEKLGVDHIYGETEHMNAIFVDSLQRHKNVCNGCFKTIYTLSTKIALEKQIPFVVTGLSRGQFFETRLTEELFWDENVDTATIDQTILEARKLYHQEEDAVKKHLDVSIFDYEDTFNKVQFIDFYRYSDVSLEEMLKFLEEKVGWVRPTDTGRSTNCLINQVGIYVHKKKMGYSNYSFPYSWDVRMGHKTRTETLEEINEVIDEKEVQRIMGEIGYFESLDDELNQERLVGYYTGTEKTSARELRDHLKKQLPDYMVPSYFKYIDQLPLTSNGKVDKGALKSLNGSQLEMDTPFVAPKGEIEELLAAIWKEVLRLKQVGVHDDFIVLGGHSLAAIRVTARINEEVEMKFPLNKVFELPTIAEYSKYIEELLTSLLEEQ